MDSTGLGANNTPTRVIEGASTRWACLASSLALTLSLAGCGVSVNKAADVGLTTSSVATPAPDTQMASDQSIIRNAVSAADLQSLGHGGMSWANTDTGSRGAISSISEYAENTGSTCRKFVVSRESYNGVSLYDGDACLVNGGAWQLRAFKSM